MTEKTAETPPLSAVAAFSRVMEDVRAVAKNDRNNDQNYSFRGVDAVMNAVGPALRTHGCLIVPICEQANYRDVLTSRGKPSRECTVMVRYRFYGPAGDYIEAVTPGESMDFGDKGAPKAMSVAYRTVLLQALCLPTHDPEPDAAAYERAPEPAREAPNQARNGAAQPSPPIVSKEAREALEELAALCDAMSLDREMVAAEFARRHHGADVRKAATPEAAGLVREFIKAVDSIDPTNLKKPAAAVNGAPA